MKIKIVYTDDQYLIINLFDNKTIRKWFEFCKNKSYKEQIIYEYPRKNDPATVNENWNKLLKSLSSLSSYNVLIPIDVPDSFNYDQQLLNQLHYVFTYNYNWISTTNVSNKFNPDLILSNEDVNLWDTFLHDLNDAIHGLELNITTIHHKSVASILRRKFFNLHLKPKTNSYIEFDETDYASNYGFLDLNYDMPVVLDDSILGKSLFESWLQHDNPNQEDCTGRKLSFGGFYVDLLNDRKKIYNSNVFQSWLDKHNMNRNLPYEFTVGYVETLSSPEKTDFYQKTIKEVYWIT